MRLEDLNGCYSATVTPEFIARRDKMVEHLDAGIRGANCEFPEHDQARRDPNQVLSKDGEMRYDTMHLVDNVTLDYKQYAKSGVHISPFIKRSILLGHTQKLVIWKWRPNNFAPDLNENTQVSYEILGVVDAKEAVDNLEYVDGKQRFKFPLK